jgi:hypothetical protein
MLQLRTVGTANEQAMNSLGGAGGLRGCPKPPARSGAVQAAIATMGP